MNILHVLSQHEVTGAETFAAALADEQVRASHSVWIVSDTFSTKTRAHVISLPIGKRKFFQRVRNIGALKRIIREKNIHVVHAHSRAASWVSYYSTRFGDVPLVSTLHGRQHVHLSSKLFHIYGEKVMAVCEGIQDHLLEELNYSPRSVSVVRNGIAAAQWRGNDLPRHKSSPHIISLVGRLSGPKGEIAKKIISEVFPKVCHRFSNVELHIVGGENEAERLTEIIASVNRDLHRTLIKYIGFAGNVKEVYRRSSLVVGSGRVVMEALAGGANVIAVGESNYIGTVSEETKRASLETNFGDAGPNIEFDAERMASDILDTLRKRKKYSREWAREFICTEFDIRKITSKVVAAYAEAIAIKKGVQEIPILLYHRITEGIPPGTKHGIYVTSKEFERQLLFLKRKGFSTLTLAEMKQVIEGKHMIPTRPVILTFDDGYEDNYTNAFPLLQKYSFSAVIFLIGNKSVRSNVWDLHDGEPEAQLMSDAQAREMHSFGIEFGSHTMNHKMLAGIPSKDIEKEVRRSKKAIEDRLRLPIISFAYPYGKLDDDSKRIVQEAGYSFGIASDTGSRNFWKDMYEIRRIQIFPGASMFSFWKKTSGCTTNTKT